MSSDQQRSVEMRAHWKSLLAMTLVSLSSFQYGLDFGIIGGLQAMVPFLQPVGSLIGTVVDNFAAKILHRGAYIIPLGMIYIAPGILAIGLFFIPESPRWLAANDQLQKAERSLRWLRPQEWSVGEELGEMNAALNAERQLQAKVGYSELFRNPIDRRRTTVAVLAMTTQAASGAMFIIAFGTYFFEMAHVGPAFENACILTGVGVAAMLANSFIITRYGRRRRLMITGVLLCGLMQLIMAIVYTVEPGTQRSGKILVGLSVIYLFAFNGLIAPYAWVAGGEIPSQRLRSHTFGLAAAIGFAGAALNWGPKYGYIWAPSCVIAALWIYFFLPEGKGRTLEEIDEMFEARVPARKFATYRCTRQHAIVEKIETEHCEKA
ncbi:hypothetical protein DL765_010314 [Monosporascus sp. GIB2]|nr:hypothetical protein DL765_010314 [Monosporascus sp. GIB2]